MKKYRFLPLVLLAALFATAIGCPHPIEPDPVFPIQILFNSPYHTNNIYHYGAVADVGTLEIPFEINLETPKSYPPEPIQMFFSFSGYGSMYLYDDSATPTILTPLESFQEYVWEYKGRGIKGLYRPPSIDEMRGIKDIEDMYLLSYRIGGNLDCRVFDKLFNNYFDLKYEFAIRIRNEPTEFYLDHFNLGEYEQNNQPVNVTVVAGETYEFRLISRPAYDKNVLHSYGISGKVTEIGEIWMAFKPIVEPWFVTDPILGEIKFFVGKYPCSYKAPDNITSPIDITASFSVGDPWDGQSWKIEQIFHLVPK